MNNTKAIFIKQFTSMLKVPMLIGQGILFLILAAAMMFLSPPETPECETHACVPAYVCAACQEIADARFQLPIPSGVGLFAVMFVGLALIGSTSSLVNEDKTTTNLRFMAMADVRPYQYLLGTLASMIIVVTVMLVFYALLGRYWGADMFWFMAIGVSGGLVSILLGVVTGLSKVPVLSLPLSLILGFGPTLSAQNETLANLLRYTFMQQVNIAIAELDADLTSNFLIIAANGAAVLLLFAIMHRKNRFNV